MVWIQMANIMTKPKLAILGTGKIAHFHVEAFRKAGFEITHGAASLNSKKSNYLQKNTL